MRKKILMVDDVQLFLDQQRSFLAREDFEVLVARSAAEAIKVANAELPDLILMDLYMPDMEGDKVCRLMKGSAALAGTPIIIVTSGVSEDDFERSWEAGCDDIILKPINFHYFLAIIKKYLPVKERKARRYVARLQVHFGRDPKQLLDDFSINVSTGGLFIETTKLLAVDTRLSLAFTLPDLEKEVRCEGRVAWVNHPEMPKNQNLPAGMGIQFVDLSLGDMNNIRHFIKERALLPMW